MGENVESRDLRSRLDHIPGIAKVITAIALLAVLVHSLLIGLWVAPSTPAREALGETTVRDYVVPWFDQSWSIFAPNPHQTAVTFEVRAWTGGDAEGEATEWVELVAHEDELISGNPFPPRTSLMVRRSADNLHSSTSDLSEDQRSIIEENLLDESLEAQRQRLADVDSPASEYEVSRHIRAEDIATALASGYAFHRWGESQDIPYVQFRTTLRSVPDYRSASEQTLDEAQRSTHTYGWRQTRDLTEGQQQAFGDNYPNEGRP